MNAHGEVDSYFQH